MSEVLDALLDVLLTKSPEEFSNFSHGKKKKHPDFVDKKIPFFLVKSKVSAAKQCRANAILRIFLTKKKSNFSRQIGQIEVLILVLFKTAMDALTRVIQ